MTLILKYNEYDYGKGFLPVYTTIMKLTWTWSTCNKLMRDYWSV